MEGFLQNNTIEAGFVPVDMSAAANDGDYVSMEQYNRCIIVAFKAAGTAGDDPTITLQQAQDKAGTGAKDLDFTVINEKVGTLSGVSDWTRVTQAAAASYVNAASAEAQGLFVIEIDADELDGNNGFTHLRARIADVGTNAQLGCVLYLMTEPRYHDDEIPSAL